MPSFLFWFFVYFSVFRVFSDDTIEERVCIGTNGRMSVPSNKEHHYRNLRDRYTNCTYVDGNLELTWLQDEHLDLSFLQYIREVTGHVLISHVDVKRIVLPRLQIIRGRTLFKLNIYKSEFALLVTLSKMHSLEMPALRDILAGSVGIFNNYNLCHVKTINWDEILTGPGAEHFFVYNFSSPERECPACDPSCDGGCWGHGPENCQKFSKINCSPQCYQGRCFGPNPRECCHLFCAGGCTGPKQSDCIACRNFYDDGVCTQECPAMQRYNPTTYSWEINPYGKYAYGATCVKKCPEHLLKDNGACVRSCPSKKKDTGCHSLSCDCDDPSEIEMTWSDKDVGAAQLAHESKERESSYGNASSLLSQASEITQIIETNQTTSTQPPEPPLPCELPVPDSIDAFVKFVAVELRGIQDAGGVAMMRQVKRNIQQIILQTWDLVDNNAPKTSSSHSSSTSQG